MSQNTLQYLVLERRDQVANIARFYVLTIEESLFGDAALIREWGRLGTIGRRKTELYETRIRAIEALEMWLRRKQQRGYRVRSATHASRQVGSSQLLPPTDREGGPFMSAASYRRARQTR